MPRKKKRRSAKEKNLNKEIPKKPMSSEEQNLKKSTTIPLEDMPLHMQEPSDELEAIPLGVEEELEEELIPAGFDVAEPIIKVEDPGPPIHFDCGGALQQHGSDGVGRWWECSSCRSEFYFRSLKSKGQIGNPQDAYTKYKLDNRPRRRNRRLT